jgi:glycosyltransferase involved in cell wall biosynthesis
MKTALVHDYLVERGGAEKVLAALHRAFPEAHIYTSVWNPETTLEVFRQADVRTSFLQRLTAHPRRYRALLPLYPLAFRSFDLRSYDLVISSASAFAKGVRCGRDARHICYCYTPPRFAWGYQDANARELFNPLARLGLRLLGPALRRVDRVGAASVDRFLTSSTFVARRIAAVYGRDATVVPPPIDCAGFAPASSTSDFFLVVSRLVPYKRIDVAIEAFDASGLPLVVVGDGRDRRRLESLARSERIHFLGHRPQDEVRELLATCRALVVTAEEDFGMVALEANASGRPVLAYGAGGARETVVQGVTGLTFREQTSAALLAALDEFRHCSFDAETLVRHARRFDTAAFQRRIEEIVTEEMRPAAGRYQGERATMHSGEVRI